MCGDPCDNMTERKMILDQWDQEDSAEGAQQGVDVRKYIFKHMLRKATYSAANGHLITGGGYLTVEEYAEALTNRVMKARKKLRNG